MAPSASVATFAGGAVPSDLFIVVHLFSEDLVVLVLIPWSFALLVLCSRDPYCYDSYSGPRQSNMIVFHCFFRLANLVILPSLLLRLFSNIAIFASFLLLLLLLFVMKTVKTSD